MHILVMDPHQRFQVPSPSDELEQVLPRLNAWPTDALARPILGEILRGEQGEWYERVGNHIRPIRHLASGPNGEVLEVPKAFPISRTPQPPADEVDEAVEEDDDPLETPSAGPVPPAEDPPRTAFRRLLTEPGAWRVLPFRPFAPLLAPQLSEPTRLRDSHRLPCQVQVFEALAPQRIEALARAILGDAAGPTDLQPLTPTLVAQLDLAQWLPRPSRVPPFSPEQGLVRPGQRFFRLTLASDPTASSQPSAPAPAPAPNPVVAPPDAAVANPPALGPDRKTEIPTLFLRPWEFRQTRDEAVAILRRTRSWTAHLMRPLRRLRHDTEFRKWQLLLSGRSADEQLWAVPPPRGWLGDPWLRDWARQTLELNGYESSVLLAEWEIFWARKGT
jgi:hypothetical protein